ncbi:hypothetical protein JCM10908_006380 [Rhodotorula pacifica]|uniref:uncharacterized protein n=1 Tax=Rhodotorula pacifica TaxID=1495444 RepID=UPI003176EBA0
MSRLAQLATAALACLALQAPGSVSAQAQGSTSSAGAASVAASLTSAASASGASSTSSPTTASASNGTLQTVEGRVPAYANSTQSALNATIQAVWSTDTARGTLTQGLTSLRDERNQTIYGVVLQFNETTATSDYSSTPIPWIAYISCDSAVQTANVPASNITATSTANSTTSANGTAPTMYNLLQQAQDLGATAVLLYSSQAQSCSLSATLFSGNVSSAANGTSSNSQAAANLTVPIFSTASQQVANIISQQFSNIPQTHRYFNSTLLTASAGNLSSILTSATSGTPEQAVASAVTDFLLARIRPTYDSSDSSNGVVATIGHASSTASATASGSGSSGTSSRPAATGDAAQNSGSGGGSTSGAAGATSKQRRRSTVTLVAVGFTTGALLAGVGLLL